MTQSVLNTTARESTIQISNTRLPNAAEIESSLGAPPLLSFTKSADFTAELDGVYVTTASLTVTDPTPFQGFGFMVHVCNGTATIGGTGYAAGQIVRRTYHSGAWASTVIATLGVAQTFTAAQTFSGGMTSTTSTTIAVASGHTLLTLGDNSSGSYSSVRLRGNGTQTNWQIGANVTIGNALEFTPSTATGGATYATPLVIFSPTVVTVAGSAPGTPSAGQILIGGGEVAAATGYKVGANQVVGARGAAVADATSADATDLATAITLVNELKAQLNTALARLRAHGLIAT